MLIMEIHIFLIFKQIEKIHVGIFTFTKVV